MIVYQKVTMGIVYEVHECQFGLLIFRDNRYWSWSGNIDDAKLKIWAQEELI